MRIAQVAPLIESVPPRLYGGTERVVSYLTEELLDQGHDVTLFASGDSKTKARLIATVPHALRLDSQIKYSMPYTVLQLEHVRQHAREFDIMHFHGDFLHFPLMRALSANSVVTTMHGRLDLLDYKALFAEFSDAQLVSVSDNQRKPLANASWLATIAHGLSNDLCSFRRHSSGEYLAFVGRISPEKRPDRAIEIAARAGVKLKIAAKVDAVDQEYFGAHIEPLLSQPHVEYIGEIDENEKVEFLGNALALLFPIDWPEPFGLALIEAMSCGTPCIAWNVGSVPEVVDHGVTGLIVDSIPAAVDAVQQVKLLDRRAVRARFEQRFSAKRMAQDYVSVYRRLLGGDIIRGAA